MDQLISLGVAGQEDLFTRFKYQGDHFQSSLDDHQQLLNLRQQRDGSLGESEKLLGPEQSGNKINKGDRSGPDHDAWTFSMVARKIGSEGCRTRTPKAIFAREVAPFLKMLRSCHLPSSVLLSVQPLFGFNDFSQIN